MITCGFVRFSATGSIFRQLHMTLLADLKVIL